jgi:hypothetical protein
MRDELTDHEWTAIKLMLANKPRGMPRVNDRRVFNGIHATRHDCALISLRLSRALVRAIDHRCPECNIWYGAPGRDEVVPMFMLAPIDSAATWLRTSAIATSETFNSSAARGSRIMFGISTQRASPTREQH